MDKSCNFYYFCNSLKPYFPNQTLVQQLSQMTINLITLLINGKILENIEPKLF